MLYTIKQIADMFGVTEHTIRFYTDNGLLPCGRDSTNKRVFDEESLNWMQGISCLKHCGASLEDIREYCELCRQQETAGNLQARYEIILRQRRQAYKRLDEANATVKYMEMKVRHYEDVLSGLIPDDTNPGTWSVDGRPRKHET